MVNQDLGFRIKQLSDRILDIEDRLKEVDCAKKETEDWDNAQLMREWGICKRSAAYYRKQGLEFYKRGGRIFYKPENREKFVKQQKLNKYESYK